MDNHGILHICGFRRVGELGFLLLYPLILSPARQAKIGFSCNLIEENATIAVQCIKALLNILFPDCPAGEHETLQDFGVRAPAPVIIHVSQ